MLRTTGEFAGGSNGPATRFLFFCVREALCLIRFLLRAAYGQKRCFGISVLSLTGLAFVCIARDEAQESR